MLSIYNKISDYIMILSYEGKVIFCNQSFLSRLNYNEDEILNLNILEIIHRENFKDSFDICGEINKVLGFYSKSKEIINVNCNLSIGNYNNEKNVFIIGKEIDSKAYTMEMLEDLLDNINICTFIIDNKGKYLYVNKGFTNILNKKKEDILGTYNSSHWESYICKELEKNNNEVFMNRNPKIFNERIPYYNDIQWYESYKAPIFDKNKRIKYIVSTAKNINLSKTISEELYKNYNRTIIKDDVNLNKILSNIGENILEYTKANGVSILLYDSNLEGLVPVVKLKNSKTYLSSIKFIPFKLSDINSNNYRSRYNCIFPVNEVSNLDILDDKYLEEVDYSGCYAIELYNEFIGFIALNYSKGNFPEFNSDEYMKYICNKLAMIIKNIRLTQEVSIENKKRKYTEKELELYLNISVDLVTIIGKDYYIKRFSPNWHNVLGWTEEELLSMQITDIIHHEDLEKFKIRKEVEELDGEITRDIIRYKHKNNTYITLEWSSVYVSDEGVYVTTAKDMTKRLEIEREKIILEEAIRLEVAKNEFFSNISHEFRTPLNIILGTMQVINKNIEKNDIQVDRLSKYTNYIKQNTYRLLRLVNNLIDISKMDIGAYELRCSNQNIVSIIEDITLSVADYTKNNKINLIFDTDNEEVVTYCDPDKIERIMLNMLSNSIKYTPENGFIKVMINTTENEVIVSIKDTGIGIPKEKLEVIFNRFGQVDGSFNRQCEGSGIGLSIVKNLVKMHGGEINVNSSVGKGTEFIFSIPIKLKQESSDKKYSDNDRKCKHVERCDIEFSDIYSM